ncbi:hypothetical protein PAXRUDRAFT_825228 [Paxillus rubicundulus Ve08.2h10]|uniref:Calcineurin-like phosphoesterase domain-containing protein n=1 Tax=Paxillus rubicundulus Ve08.2h10 TaxID=930991 RepID=A0A0D0EB50_9AGAM|nr:hypothetical protein PAXRUDRAFT_825228 [Paxillus rubicundulus Ve08.2h10]
MLKLVLLLLGLCPFAVGLPAQVLLNNSPAAQTLRVPLDQHQTLPVNAGKTDRRLHGRFLHITDMHPDPYYLPGSSPSTYCHRMKPKKKKRAGYYGTPFNECDSPLALTNFTLDYLEDHWSDDIDFVIWTGDSSRHEDDDKLPRPLDEIYDLNRLVARQMQELFLSKGIPVVPSLGNNDIWPHNTLLPGPNDITRTFSLIWSNFIPQSSLGSFLQGGYYSVEVIPDSVAVISLNTMYYYDSNKAVKGCPLSDPNDPGNLQFDWLDEQLETFRSRQMQVWVIGHIPASNEHYFPECYYRYVELSLRFQDTILGHLFGHQNIDHFFFLEADDLFHGLEIKSESLASSDTLFETLITDFAALPDSQADIDYDHYAVVNVNPSVVPNPYLPSFRVFAYNVTGLANVLVSGAGHDPYQEDMRTLQRRNRAPHNHGSDAGDCEKAKSWRCRLERPWGSNAESPSRKNTLWSPLGYAQYYMPKLKEYDEDNEPEFELEYVTFPLSKLQTGGEAMGGDESLPPLIPSRNLPEELHHGGGGLKSKYAPYNLDDLTIPSWLDLAWRLGQRQEKKLRKRFRKYMYMGGEES